MANYLCVILLCKILFCKNLFCKILVENPLFELMPSAAAMPMAAVTVPVKMMQRAAEAALDRAAEGLAVRAGHGGQSGTAIPLPDKAHRHGADGSGPHHGQDDAA
jgi:hypothetical protein